MIKGKNTGKLIPPVLAMGDHSDIRQFVTKSMKMETIFTVETSTYCACIHIIPLNGQVISVTVIVVVCSITIASSRVPY